MRSLLPFVVIGITTGAVYALAYRPDGKQVASAGFDGVVRLNDAQTGKLIKEFVGVPVAPPASSSAKK